VFSLVVHFIVMLDLSLFKLATWSYSYRHKLAFVTIVCSWKDQYCVCVIIKELLVFKSHIDYVDHYTNT